MTNTIYKVTSYGGMEGRTFEVDYYNTEDNAKNRIANDDWNSGFRLYKVTITVNEKGKLITKEEEINL